MIFKYVTDGHSVEIVLEHLVMDAEDWLSFQAKFVAQPDVIGETKTPA